MSTGLQTHVVVIAGGLGAGNEIVMGMLRRLGHFAVDADDIAEHLTSKGGSGYQEVVDRLGSQFLDSKGELDRARINRAAQGKPELVQELRSIVYPLVEQQLRKLIGVAGEHPVFIKANNLDAYGLRGLSDHIWTVSASDDARIANLVNDHKWTLALARQFVRAQPARSVQARDADTVLQNDGSRAGLWTQVIEALRKLEAAPEAAPAAFASPVVQAVPVVQSTTAVPAASASIVEAPKPGKHGGQGTESLRSIQLRLIGRDVLTAVLILLALAFLTSWGLLLAEYGRQHLPIPAWQAISQACMRTIEYLTAHPQTYYWAHQDVPWFGLVSKTLGNSAGLLLLSMGLALILGLPLGIAAATARHKFFAAIVMVLSVLGASTPSFLLAMMLWVVNAAVHRSLGIKGLPSTGFGWDTHMIMPILVLAMRPLAQVAQVTYVSLSDVLRQDYVRTAYSKGLTWRAIRDRHILRNTLIPILTTLGTSLRFSLASLPIIEIFFRWPGVGSMLLDAINQGTDALVLDLIISLGLFFLLVNFLIEFCFPLIDPQLHGALASADRSDHSTLKESLAELRSILGGWYAEVRDVIARPAKWLPQRKPARANMEILRVKRRNWLLHNLLRNPILIGSSLILLVLIGLAAFGSKLTGASPYELHGVMKIDGEYAAPPFKPSAIFPWGTDHIGRDIRALVLAGAQRTISLAFFGMVARVLLGSILGLLAGWRRGGRFDRLVTAATGVWAAFPATLFAMIVIQALGIQQGMWVFVVAICVVGWGEVAQFVRGQVASLKPRLFVESARSVGARADQILVRHILPNLANPILVLAAMEMGGILMLLAELGFLNVFMGGGFRTMIGESGSMQPIIAYYSDLPEWGALIANVRAQWRSYPWMALAPGLAVLISILSFNLFGEGLRRFLDDSAVNLSRLFNRYTFAAAVSIGVVIVMVLQSSVPLNMYRAEGLKFDQQRVMNDIRVLSSPQLQGRETGTAGASLAALYIAQRMAEIGIFPAGEHHSYFQRIIQPRLHLASTPTLATLDASGASSKEFVYRTDFAEVARLGMSQGDASARVVGVAYGPLPDTDPAPDLRDGAAFKNIVIVRAADLAKVKWGLISGILVVAEDAEALERRDLYPQQPLRGGEARPCMLITPEVADTLLQTAGSSLADLDAARASLATGGMTVTGKGTAVRMSVPAFESENALNEAYINVIGVIPGQGHFMGTEEQVVVVSAYYDGLGTDTRGTVYDGANDNASGVAMMLELARLLKGSVYQPDKTVLFVAWAGGERQEGLSVVNVLNARPGASDMTTESVLEFSGVGYGTGTSISIGTDSSYRLVQVFQQAAGRYHVATTTRGRGPHYDEPMPSIFGGRDAMTLSLSWDGSDSLSHTPGDTFETIDPAKIQAIGRPAYLTLLVLCRETEY